MCDKRGFFSLRKVTEAHPNQYYFERIDTCDNALHIPQELRIRSRGTERHSASN